MLNLAARWRFAGLAEFSWRNVWSFYRSWWRRDSVWWGVSVAAHCFIFVLLALLILALNRPHAGASIAQESFDERAFEAAEGGVAIAANLPVTDNGEGGSEELQDSHSSLAPEEDSDSDQVGGGMFASTDQPLLGGLGGFDVSGPEPGPAIDGDGGVGAGIGAGVAPGNGGDGEGIGGHGSKFFGISGSGHTFVYVMDCSESMLNERRFERAKTELLESVARLSPKQRFYVILFNDNSLPMDADAPVPATTQEVAKLRAWLESANPATGTQPLSSLLFALAMEPDAIYFLSDGEFDPNAIYELRAKNRAQGKRKKPIPVHTISLGGAGESLMKIISRTSGGKYRLVN